MQTYIAVLVLLLSVAACGSPKAEETAANGNANLVKLSAEDRKSLGLTVGEFHQEKLSADLKINGQTAIQNQDKALITSSMGGMVKIISLQEEYLSLPSKIELVKLELRRQKELNAGQAGSLKQLQQIEADLKLLTTRQTSLQTQLNIISKHSQQNINGSSQIFGIY